MKALRNRTLLFLALYSHSMVAVTTLEQAQKENAQRLQLGAMSGPQRTSLQKQLAPGQPKSGTAAPAQNDPAAVLKSLEFSSEEKQQKIEEINQKIPTTYFHESQYSYNNRDFSESALLERINTVISMFDEKIKELTKQSLKSKNDSKIALELAQEKMNAACFVKYIKSTYAMYCNPPEGMALLKGLSFNVDPSTLPLYKSPSTESKVAAHFLQLQQQSKLNEQPIATELIMPPPPPAIPVLGIITAPTAKSLEISLERRGIHDFVSTTRQILDPIYNREIELAHLLTPVSQAVQKYNKTKPITPITDDIVLEALLLNYPGALQQIKDVKEGNLPQIMVQVSSEEPSQFRIASPEELRKANEAARRKEEEEGIAQFRVAPQQPLLPTTTIKVPNAKTLKQRFIAEGYPYFAESNAMLTLINTLGDDAIDPVRLLTPVSTAVRNYKRANPDSTITEDKVLGILLQGYPRALLEELKEHQY